MIQRLIKPLKSNSFFIFGPRGTGKTTFLHQYFSEDKPLWIDLLDPSMEERYSRAPETLTHQLEVKKGAVKWVVVDEIQKVPKLLDLAHYHIEKSGARFAMTGSSARKLKKGAANLLAGRAFVNHLHPMTHLELGNKFHLDDALRWGTLPRLIQLTSADEKKAFLQAYALTYIKEEIWAEHIIRRLDPFRRFLEFAAQANGEIVNYANVSQDVGADIKTVQSYFEILEDTLIGLLLEPYGKSIRARQRKNPKFYFFDTGVARAMARQLDDPLVESTPAHGKAFEHFVILEIYRLSQYGGRDYRMSYLRTKDDAEIDLILERSGKSPILIEIKAANRVTERHTRHLERFLDGFEKARAYCLSRDPVAKKINRVMALPWQEGLGELDLL